MRMRGAAVALLCGLSLPGPAGAGLQGGPAQRRPQHDEALRMIDAYIVSNMQEALGINDDQFARLLPLVKRMQRDRREFTQRRIQAMVELRRTLHAGTANEARVIELLRELKAVEAEQPSALRRNMDAIDAVLSPVQQAKYRILEAEVERRLRALMSRMRGPNRMGRGEGPEN